MGRRGSRDREQGQITVCDLCDREDTSKLRHAKVKEERSLYAQPTWWPRRSNRIEPT